MSQYPKIIERPYKVYMGEQKYYMEPFGGSLTRGDVCWGYSKSFRLESDAEAYAERIAEEYEFVKIEKKESE